MAVGETIMSIASWIVCSVGMMVFNKLVVKELPLPATVVGIQMVFTVFTMLSAYKTLHIGSVRDALRWSMVAPFFTGMLLTSMLALHGCSMTLVLVIRSLGPILATVVERFYPSPPKQNWTMLVSLAAMIGFSIIYALHEPPRSFKKVYWVILNLFIATGDRLLQRLMLSKDQQPVDISKTALSLLNNVYGSVAVLVVIFANGEYARIGPVFQEATTSGWVALVLSCVVGVGISYTGIWAQSLISAASFLVLINANKIFIILIDAFIIKDHTLDALQWVGALGTIAAGFCYGGGQAMQTSADRKAAEAPSQKDESNSMNDETKPLLDKNKQSVP